MSETELSVVCKNCGSEVSPYVTECPYCGARIRKRAPKLERRGDGLEPKAEKRRRLRSRRSRSGARDGAERPLATMGVIGVSAVMLLLLVASGDRFDSYGGYIAGVADEPWRYLTSPFTYTDVGYWFVVALALAIYGPPIERRLGSVPTAFLMVGCGALGMIVAANLDDAIGTIITGGNGIALGTVAAWFVIRRSEAAGAIDDDYDKIGVAVTALVLLLLPVFDSSANVFAGVAGGLVGGFAGLATTALRPND